jgi:histidinol phosphatase-like PHP family hydrolase
MKKSFLKLDPHTHSNGVSLCSRVSVEEIIDQKIQTGYQAIMLTNHCQSHYYPATEHGAYVERVIAEYKKAKAYGEKKNFVVLLGLEVTIVDPAYNDWLLFGVTEEILRKSPCFYQLSQKQLFDFCVENDMLLVQAHPFRNSGWGVREYMHGVEINCSQSDIGRADEVVERALERGFLVTAGSDYHFPETKQGGMFVPDTVQTSVDLVKYLKTTKQTQVFADGKEWSVPAPLTLEK